MDAGSHGPALIAGAINGLFGLLIVVLEVLVP
jgi:hypothetical protein